MEQATKAAVVDRLYEPAIIACLEPEFTRPECRSRPAACQVAGPPTHDGVRHRASDLVLDADRRGYPDRDLAELRTPQSTRATSRPAPGRSRRNRSP